jgi:predicted NBD/HSP70 family sugar kinase
MKKIDLKKFRSADHRVLRDINEAIVLNLVRERQPVSRVAIAEASGLEEGTISRIVQRFLEKGLVYESGVGNSTPAGGRKPRYLHINPTKRCAIGVDIGPLETLLALSDLNGHLHQLKRIPHSRHALSFLTGVAEEVQSLIHSAKTYQEFGGVGVSMPGLLDIKEGIILEGENLGWGENIPVGKTLRSKIDPEVPIFYENGARLSALGEIWFGTTHLSGFRDVVFMDVSEGVGTGIIINGQLYLGHQNGAGEFGHVCIDPAGPRCSCGSHGCLEAFASDLATIERCRKNLKSAGQTSRAKTEMLDMGHIVEMARLGDQIALDTLRETGHYLGLGIAPILYGLNPEAVVIGGKIAEAWPLISSTVMESLATRVSIPYLQNTKILASTLHIRPSLLGSIALVLAQDFAAPDIL